MHITLYWSAVSLTAPLHHTMATDMLWNLQRSYLTVVNATAWHVFLFWYSTTHFDRVLPTYTIASCFSVFWIHNDINLLNRDIIALHENRNCLYNEGSTKISSVFGYKIEDKSYNSINYFLAILLFTIYKSHYVPKQKENHINVFQLFKIELKNRFESDKLVNCHTHVFVQKVIDLI